MNDESTPLPTPAGETALPLREAVLAWCDPMLVLEFAAARHDRVIVHVPRPWTRRAGEEWGYDLATELHLAARLKEVEDHERAILDRQTATEAALVRDFRKRLACGEIALTGLRARPNLDPARSAIPATWADLFEFDWEEASVRAEDVEYIDVQGERVQPSAAAGGTAGRQVQPTSEASAEPARNGRVVRGRENYGSLIEEALLARYGDAFAKWTSAPHTRPANTVVARELRKWLVAKYPDRHKKKHLPSEETIRTRWPSIYDRVRGRKAV